MLSMGFSNSDLLFWNQKPAEAGLCLVNKHVVQQQLDPVASQTNLPVGVVQISSGIGIFHKVGNNGIHRHRRGASIA